MDATYSASKADCLAFRLLFRVVVQIMLNQNFVVYMHHFHLFRPLFSSDVCAILLTVNNIYFNNACVLPYGLICVYLAFTLMTIIQ